MTNPGEFSVYQFFVDDSYEEVVRFVSAEDSVHIAKNLVTSIGGKLGTTKRIIITDGGDCTCFEWIHGLGVVFPPQQGETKQ